MREGTAIPKKRITVRAARQKGKDLEDYVADEIVRLGLDPKARRDGASGAGNREKGDIITSLMVLGQNVGIECKNHKTLSIPDWWRQTKKLETLGREPVLAYKLPGDSYDGTLVTIYLSTFLELVKNSGVPVIEYVEVGDNRDRKYRLDNLKRAVNEALKVL